MIDLQNVKLEINVSKTGLSLPMKNNGLVLGRW